MSIARSLTAATDTLAKNCQQMQFTAPVTHTYHPLIYAREAHRLYLQKYAATRKRAVFLGINPGPWGMGQTGIPFGEINAVKNWMEISATVRPPSNMHPKRPVLGFACRRSEVSGRRLWNFFAGRYPNAGDFFAEHLVLNYCPLLLSCIVGNRCVNLTPDKLSPQEKEKLFAACDDFLRFAADLLQPDFLIGIGGFAEQRLAALFGGGGATIGKILHPSPASPAANRNFAAVATMQLQTLGVWP